MSDQQTKAALITGSSRGIGRGIARALAAEGWSLMLTARGRELLDEAVAEIRDLGVDVIGLPADVSVPAQVDDLFGMLKDRFGRLDVLVNNAAVFDGGTLDTLSVEAWDRVIETNLRGPFLCTSAAMRIMKPQGGGRIINIGSIAGLRVRPETGPYAASKAGLLGLTQVTALEGRDHNITCCCLNTGNTQVERRVGSQAPEDQEPMMSTDEIASVVTLMATLPPHVQMLEATVIPHQQLFVGRG